MDAAAQVPRVRCRRKGRPHPRQALRTKNMLRRFQAAATYWIGTSHQALTLLVTVGLLACLVVPTLALSTGDDPQTKDDGCPVTHTGDAAPCIAKDGSDVVTPPAQPSTSDGGSTDKPADNSNDQPAAGGDTAVAGAPGPSGPQPLSDQPPADGQPANPPPPPTSTEPQTPPANQPDAPAQAPTTTTTTTTTTTAPPPPAAPKPAPSRRPAARLGKPRVESQAPVHPDQAPTTRAKQILSTLPSGGGVSGIPPSLPISSPLAPSPATGSVPNLLLDRFPIPPFLLPIYQAAGVEYDVPWQVLAAINEIETDYGRNLSVSSAGAEGWMQFMPSSWRTYGVDANGDGRKDPYNPADAIFAAARYLKAAGAAQDIRQAIFSYNHAWWYVDSVMLRAKLVRALPGDLVASLTGLTQGRIPVSGPARWVRVQRDRRHKNPRLLVDAPPAAPVVAVNDGQVVNRGFSQALGAYLTLRDVYGNTYTYTHMGSVARDYAAIRPAALAPTTAKPQLPTDPRPDAPASAGNQHGKVTSLATPAAATATTSVIKERLFAHPARPASYAAGGSHQVTDLEADAPAPTGQVSQYFAGPVRLSQRDLLLRPLRPGAQVLAGTVLGHVGPANPSSVLSDMDFEVRPAGRGAPTIDPKPFLNGWHLLAASGVYGGVGSSALRAGGHPTVGQILLMTKDQLIQLVLNDPRIRIYPCGREDIATGQIDRRVLATLAYLAASGLNPLVSALKCGHSFYTSAGTLSEHSYGDAVDIASINGIAILGHQGPGSITETTIRKLLLLQGTMKPHQIISLMTFPGTDNTLSLPDHANHIHVGFSPAGATGGADGVAAALQPGQWDRLVSRLGEIENPTLAVPGQPGS
jgi:hypothetical protein